MSTRAVYTFKSKFGDEIFHVYKYSDGYPRGAYSFIYAASKLAWELPRFQASDFAAAFIAANKKKGGDVYMTRSFEDHEDLDYRYEIYVRDGQLKVKAYERIWSDTSSQKYVEIYDGDLERLEIIL